jgi:catechol 2,3-dioxygenase-like lactoylglutathione lyase family enzyme
MIELPVPPQQPTVRMVKFLHAVWTTRAIAAGYEFHTNVLGFRPSDWIERRVVFLHCADRYHHSAGLVEMAGQPMLQHICIQVESIDDVMRARNNALARGAELLMDLLRHAASGSIGIYVKDPDLDFSIEFCCEHPQVDDDHRARILPKSRVTSDLWQEMPAVPPVPPPPLMSLPLGHDGMGSARETA